MTDLENTHSTQLHVLIAKKPQKGENHKGSTITQFHCFIIEGLFTFILRILTDLQKTPQEKSSHIVYSFLVHH